MGIVCMAVKRFRRCGTAIANPVPEKPGRVRFTNIPFDSKASVISG
jgi:hypothetical protein